MSIYHKEQIKKEFYDSNLVHGEYRLISLSCYIKDPYAEIYIPPTLHERYDVFSFNFSGQTDKFMFSFDKELPYSANTANIDESDTPINSMSLAQRVNVMFTEWDSASRQILTLKGAGGHIFRFRNFDPSGGFRANFTFVLDNKKTIEWLSSDKVPIYTSPPGDKEQVFENYEGKEQYDKNEPDWNRMGRNEKITRTIVSYKEDNISLNVPVPFDIDSWDEPKPYYNAFYPENKVFYTHHGLLIELDDTMDNRRFHIYHPSNTYIEISEDGNLVFRNSGNRYDIIDETLFMLIKGDHYKTISGSYTRLVENEEISQIVENRTQEVGGEDSLTVNNNKYEEVGGDDNSSAQLSKYITSQVSTHISGGGAVNIDGQTISINNGSAEPATMQSDIELESIKTKLQQSNRWWNEI